MALNNKKVQGNGGGNRVEQPNLEVGTYPARLVQLIDLGLQPQRPFAGKEKPPAQEIMLTYELVDEFMKDEDGNDVLDKPRWLSESMPFHNLQADKARSTARYHAFDPQELWEGEFSKAVGMPCNLTIVHNEKEGKTYDNVGNVAAMRPKDAANCPEPQNPVAVFDLDDPDMEVYARFPEWIQKKLCGNLNFKGSLLEAAIGRGEGKRPEKGAAKAPAAKKDRNPPFEADDDDSNNPY